MSKRFFGNKKYVFSARLFLETEGSQGYEWIYDIDGRKVNVNNKTRGKCKGNSGIAYNIIPRWCEEVQDE